MIAEDLRNLFVKKKLTLSLAESCTGGAIAACITNQPGASEYFLGGIVAYSNDLKKKTLKVKDQTLREHGPFSSETVTEMVQGIMDLTGSDYAIAVSGIAGPNGGTTQKPVGTIWAAIGQKGEAPVVWVFREAGDRSEIIAAAVNSLLTALYEIVKKG